ncbi:hypothetical protein SPHINGOAX6_30380 [Sphingomonas sp. AX6]|nr:hypothetical protein SPHINGOAX6_30380 [Sphingomonas sp. AX6]
MAVSAAAATAAMESRRIIGSTPGKKGLRLTTYIYLTQM